MFQWREVRHPPEGRRIDQGNAVSGHYGPVCTNVARSISVLHVPRGPLTRRTISDP